MSCWNWTKVCAHVDGRLLLEAFHSPIQLLSFEVQIEKVMRALFVRKLHLWPRFEATCKDVLDAVDQQIQVDPIPSEHFKETSIITVSTSPSDIVFCLAQMLCYCIPSHNTDCHYSKCAHILHTAFVIFLDSMEVNASLPPCGITWPFVLKLWKAWMS